MATVGIGSSIKLTVRFYDYQGGPLVDPDPDIALDITYQGESVLDNPKTYQESEIIREDMGVYSYHFEVPPGSPTGEYEAHWTATQEGTPIHGVEKFTVIYSPSIDPVGEGTLGVDYEINYTAMLEPAFMDPEEILAIFPEAEAPMVMESIHRVSLQILNWVPKATADNLSPQMRQYLVAAVACDLSQRYGLLGSEEYSITLGDLSVTYDQYSDNSKVGRVTDWCSIAAELQSGIRYGLAPVKGVVRGARLSNPIPKRSIDKKHSRIHLQGTLDDVEGSPPRF